MKLRKLKISDAEGMLEWMHDKELCLHMQADFASKQLKDCIAFINSAESSEEFYHRAIVDDEDRYMGTVSLKHISKELRTAEFGIVVRRCACGKGYSIFGMREILKIAFRDLHLEQVIWCVSRMNVRANKFYQKNNFKLCNSVPDEMKELYNGVPDLLWYGVNKNEIDFFD